MSNTMRAATIVRPGEIVIQEVPIPKPGPEQVLVALEGTGVCASNLPLWEGAPWFQYPLAPGCGGHEGWGIIERVGERADDALVGRRVAFLSGHAYADWDVANADQVVLLPPSLDGMPFPGEALGCAMNIMARSAISAGQWVAVVGVGFLGALLTRLASRAGARVLALSRRDSALALARAMGAEHTLVLDAHGSCVEAARELTGGALCDRVIEATGKQIGLDVGTKLVREHGRLIIAGYHQDGPRHIDMQLWNWRGIDVINAHERNPEVALRGIRAAVAAVGEGWLDPMPLYTGDYTLEQLGQAFDDVAQRPDGFLKALVRMEQRT